MLKTWFLFLVCKKGQKKDKSEFVSKSVGMIVTNFHVKISLILLVKHLLYSFLFTDHLNLKTENKTTCITPSANPGLLSVHLLKSFRTVAISFWGFQDFLIYLAKYFWSLLNSPNLITQQYFTKSNATKTV